jgi:RNA polymerase sigma factor (sigma-70 family)
MEQKYDSLSTYISLAKKTISKFAPKFYSNLAKEMLSNDEAVSDIATAIMYADWRFDPNRVGKTGNRKTKYSYRNQCAIWAIKTYVSNKYKKKVHMSLDYNSESDQSSMGSNTIDENNIPPVDILISQERTQELKDCIDLLLTNDMLSDKQKDQIRMYYFEDMTLSEIGKKYSISREAVRQSIKRAFDTIRKYDAVST